MCVFEGAERMGIINEDGKRLKGVEFDVLKLASPEQKKILRKDPLTSTLVKAQGKGNTVAATTSIGKDKVDSQMQSRIESFDKERARYILESEDIVKEYNQWIDADLDNMTASFDRNVAGGMVEHIMKTYNLLLNRGDISKEEIRRYLQGTFYYKSDNPANIQLLLTLRLKYNEKVTNLLSQMLRINYAILGYTDQEMEILSKKLESKGNESNTTALDIRARIYQNKNQFLTNNGECVDLTKLGFGKIFITKGKDTLGLNANMYGDHNNDLHAFDSLLQKSMKYDAIVLCHGMSANRIDISTIRMQMEILRRAYTKMGYSESDILKSTQDWDVEDKTISEDDKKANLIKKRWIMQPIRSDRSDYFMDMNSFIYQLTKEGYKKIMIAACNPGHHKLDPAIMALSGVKIVYSDYSNLIESTRPIDSIDKMLLETENNLKELAEFNGFTYEEVCNVSYDEIVTEGFVGDIVGYAKKILKWVIGLFVKLFNNIKRVVTNVKDKLLGHKPTENIHEKINFSVIDLSGDANVKAVSVQSYKDLEAVTNDALKSLQKEFQKNQATQVKATRVLANFTEHNLKNA